MVTKLCFEASKWYSPLKRCFQTNFRQPKFTNTQRSWLTMANSVYRPLDSVHQEIRLLRLLPAERINDPLQAELLYGLLDDADGSYEALSYTWGETNRTGVVSLDGGQCKTELCITTNLDTALRYIRLPKEPRILWVDAICINQDDLAERSHQVTLMRSIYSRCSRDIAWLGALSPDSEADKEVRRGMDFMRKLQSKRLEDLVAEYFGKFFLDYDQQDMLEALFKNPRLWSRVWVMQELACAPEVTLMYMDETLDWRVVSDFLGDGPYADAFHLPAGHHSVSLVSAVFDRAQTIEHQRRIMRDVESKGYTSTLLDVLARFKFATSTDPRDRIYGLLGLVSEKHNIRVDYRKAASEVFAEASRLMIDSSANLDIICQNPWRTDELPEPPFCSWAADFGFDGSRAVDDDYDDGFSRLVFAQRAIYSAGRPECDVPVHVSADGKILRLKGKILGQLGPVRSAKRHDCAGEPVLDYLPHDWLKLYLSDIPQREFRRHSYINGEPLMQAYWRTLVMDCTAYPIRRLTEREVREDVRIFHCDILEQEPGPLENPQLTDIQVQTITGMYSPLTSQFMWGRIRDGGWAFCKSTEESGSLFLMIRPKLCREGDVIAALDGGKVPVILREVEQGHNDSKEGEGKGEKRYRVVCMAYVHGFMDSEAMTRDDLKEQHLWIE
ncbi:putative het domain protein [Diplogelasinospora grovesii]|uniref:Het domain protein n=1 Tax=Diplogelasinospora grovesii TaxID=303347 RepID=A0AAN6S1M1_9PEZI|nr:putative het domain protein [Diplogelasinospora grovesii]